MPPRKTPAPDMPQDGVPGSPADPEYVDGYQVGHADGVEIGRQQGYAQGVAESGNPTAIAEAEGRGFQRGWQAALESKRPPLFEAAKAVYETHFDAPAEAIRAKIEQLEAEYDERVSVADLGLLENIAKRMRLAAEAQRQSFVTAARPRSEVGKQVARKLAEDQPRQATTYETVN